MMFRVPICRFLALTALLGMAAPAGPRADDWPQWRGPRRDGVWRETGIVQRFNKDVLPATWRTPIGPGYAGPAVAGGKVFVMDRGKEAHTERVHCLDARTGEILWTHEYPCRYSRVGYPSGPRCTPSAADQKVYSLGAMGHLFCLEAATGKVVWSKDYVKDFGTSVPTWGVAAAPLVDGKRLLALVGGKDGATVMAFDKDTGREIWRALPTQPMGYGQMVIIEAGGTRQLIVWLPEQVVSLDPVKGTVYWREPFTSKEGMTVATPIFDGRRLFVSTFYDGPLMLQLAPDRPAASVLWRGKSHSEMEEETDGLHCMISTPLLLGDSLYGVCSYGALRCLDADTGKRLWATYKPTGNDRWWNAFLIRHEDRVFLANEQGDLIIAKLSPQGYRETSRARLIEPTNRVRRRMVVWSHPAFAHRHVFARNDREILCASLAEEGD